MILKLLLYQELFINVLLEEIFFHVIIVLCDTYKPDGTPLSNNYRPQAKEIFDEYFMKSHGMDLNKSIL